MARQGLSQRQNGGWRGGGQEPGRGERTPPPLALLYNPGVIAACAPSLTHPGVQQTLRTYRGPGTELDAKNTMRNNTDFFF